jgi:uncharacterized SAM-binding protein YcdF (DUF218 family)
MTPDRRRRTRLVLVLGLAGLAALWLSGLFWFVRATESMQPPTAARPLDAIVALTGGTRRIETGFALLKDGLGKKLFISGVYRGVEARELMRLSRQESVEKLDCCVALGSAEDTIGNVEETSAWLKREGYKSLYLVTSNYHMKRALLEFRNTGGDFDIQPWPVAPEKLDMRNWWRDRAFLSLIVREYNKYVVFLFRYALIRIS